MIPNSPGYTPAAKKEYAPKKGMSMQEIIAQELAEVQGGGEQ